MSFGRLFWGYSNCNCRCSWILSELASITTTAAATCNAIFVVLFNLKISTKIKTTTKWNKQLLVSIQFQFLGEFLITKPEQNRAERRAAEHQHNNGVKVNGGNDAVGVVRCNTFDFTRKTSVCRFRLCCC